MNSGRPTAHVILCQFVNSGRPTAHMLSCQIVNSGRPTAHALSLLHLAWYCSRVLTVAASDSFRQMAASLVQHLRGVACFLESSRGQASFVEASALQRQAVQDKIRNTGLDITAASDVIEAARAVPWHPTDLDLVLSSITTAAAAGQEACGHSCRTSRTYSTTAVRRFGSRRSPLKLWLRLGCRHPTEPTMQSATALFLLCSQGLHTTLSMSTQHTLTTFRALKKITKAMSKGPPAVWISRLPEKPSDYQKAYPAMYEAVFS